MKALSAPSTPRLAPAARRGFSIIELLVAVIIIGILVTTIVPRLTDRSEEAKRTRARQDLQIIQSALEQVVIDTSYMVRLHVLDDVRGGDGIPNQVPNAPADRIDGFGDEQFNTFNDFNAGNLFIDPASGDLLANGLPKYTLLNGTESAFAWKGPYLTYQSDNNSTNGDRTWIGSDPWGSDYLLFTPKGMLLEGQPTDANNGTIVTTVTIPATGGNTYDTVVFDRITILSLGPNALPGDGTVAVTDGFGRGDDIFRSF